MTKKLILLILLISGLLQAEIDQRVIGYFISWGVYGRDYHVMDIPADKITHINYAFANIDATSLEIILGDPYADIDKYYPGDSWEPGSLRGSFHQLQILKEDNPHLKTLISVGGWTWSTCFSLLAATPESRQNFAASCVDFIQQYGFDGVDIDWEYPVEGGMAGNYYSPDDPQNFVLLLAEMRSQLDAAGDYLLTVATPASPQKLANHDLAGMNEYLDWFNIMSYDFHGPWGGEGDAVTGHLSALYPQSNDPLPAPFNTSYNCHTAVQTYLANNIDSSKLQLGIPFYGRGFAGVDANNNGLYQNWSNCPWFGTWENGVFDYNDLKENYIALNGYNYFWDEEAMVPWLYNEQEEIMITFADTASVAAKSEYVINNQLGGAMFWELSSDHNQELLDKIYDVFASSNDTYYGDINEDGDVSAYDASLALQYLVGIDPLPLLDPLPWEDDRIIRADVDGNGSVGAYDSALILRYTVGIISHFPAED